MQHRIGTSITFDVFYVATKTGKTGLTVVVDVWRGMTQIVSAGAAAEIGGGLYSYTLAAGSVTLAGHYRALFRTADTSVDQQHIAALQIVGTDWVERIDAVVSSRLPSSSYIAPPNVGAIDAQLSSAHGSGLWVGGSGGGISGPGASPCTLVIEAPAGRAVADADVWVSSDAAGAQVVAGTLQTNSVGRVRLLLDDGVTYYLWMQKDGINSILGQQFIAQADP